MARAWLARGYDLRGDLVAAQDYAERALGANRPMGPVLTERLFDIVARSPDLEARQAALERQLAVAREVVQRSGQTPGSLRDLSVALSKVGDVAVARGDLDAASAAYSESLGLARRLVEGFGETPESLRDLSLTLQRVGHNHEGRGDVAGAVDACTEALHWYERLERSFGEPVPGRRADGAAP